MVENSLQYVFLKTFMKKILYVGYYDDETNKKENRNYVLAATNKMRYIAKKLSKEYEVEIVSASQTLNKAYYKGRKKDIEENVVLQLFSTLPFGNKVQRILARAFLKMQLFVYLLLMINKDSKVLVYHSLAYMNLIKLLHRLKKFELILEIEEIYGDVLEDEKTVRKEEKFFADANKFIFPTELLNERINSSNKPYKIIYGTYEVEQDQGDAFKDDKIHVVYAGTFDVRKGGAMAAVLASQYLDENYHVHILGFGNQDDTQKIIKSIEEMDAVSDAKITYEGLIAGVEYIKFIQKCQIGLSTQNPEGNFNNTSFPSKILSYMANGLRVVSIKIPVIERAKIGKYIYYYEKQDPINIANAIKGITLDDKYDGRKIVGKLDLDFGENICKFVEKSIV